VLQLVPVESYNSVDAPVAKHPQQEMRMSVPAGLRALLTGSIDYAGLFPPASLTPLPALQEYVRHRDGPDAWLQGRFLCPVGGLPELSKFADQLDKGAPFAFSAIGPGASTAGAFACGLLGEEAAIYRFRHKHKERVVVDRYEALAPVLVNPRASPFPLEGDLSPGAIAGNLIHKVAVIVGQKKGCTLLPFLEMPATPNWRAEMGAVIATMGQRTNYPTGFKLRCGGAAVPPVEQLAFVIATCRDAGVPLKFTAGLHQPLPHGEGGSRQHGFVNVFTAGVLAHARRLTEEQLRPVLEEADASAFAFDDAGLRWRDQGATVAEIERARQEGVTSFGSCSFEEPRDGLRQLGWL